MKHQFKYSYNKKKHKVEKEIVEVSDDSAEPVMVPFTKTVRNEHANKYEQKIVSIQKDEAEAIEQYELVEKGVAAESVETEKPHKKKGKNK